MARVGIGMSCERRAGLLLPPFLNSSGSHEAEVGSGASKTAGYSQQDTKAGPGRDPKSRWLLLVLSWPVLAALAGCVLVRVKGQWIHSSRTEK